MDEAEPLQRTYSSCQETSHSIGKLALALSKAQGRFWSKVRKSESCWFWTAYCDSGKYGVFCVGRKLMKAHRVAWLLTHGSIPNGHGVLHSCDNPTCVNPVHLFTGTHSDNMRDMAAKGRGKYPNVRGSRNPQAKLNPSVVNQIRQSDESCHRLAKKLGVAVMTVWRAKTRNSWSEVE